MGENLCPKRRSFGSASISYLSAAVEICVEGHAICRGHSGTPARQSVSDRRDLKEVPEGFPSSEVLSLLMLMPCMEPFFFCCLSICAECSTARSAINTGVT